MTSNSGKPGHCERCGCANDNHTFGRCAGRSGRGSKSTACYFEWSRCTSSGHDDITEAKYIDCKRCPDHPGAPPSSGEFWGSQPGDEHPIFTADQLGIPWPDENKGKATSQGQGQIRDDGEHAQIKGHSRVDSGGSEDQLQWSEEKYEEATTSLVHVFGQTTITDDSSLTWSDWNWSDTKWLRYRLDSSGEYMYDYQEHTGTWSARTWDPDAKQYYYQTRDPSGKLFSLYSETSGESSASATRSTSGKKGKGRKK